MLAVGQEFDQTAGLPGMHPVSNHLTLSHHHCCSNANALCCNFWARASTGVCEAILNQHPFLTVFNILRLASHVKNVEDERGK